ncbi:WD40-repeat-containing domain protein [Leptodontidium sp. MPI-SDFR-AT-0119]|nr:WD40-repeat-containing domain protein [Leptodontidium sp. MPI-SDFR-AT-0119]
MCQVSNLVESRIRATRALESYKFRLRCSWYDYSQKNLSDPQNDKCLEDLRTTNPRLDKKRIEETKGGLLRDSYRWILENSEFQQWRDDKQSRMLWIRGDPGKGKTMLLCGIIDEFKATASAASASGSCLLSYFFCQATDDSLNSATAVLRGLIYLLAKQQPALLQHIRVKYDDTGKALFVDKNSWFALSEIFINILHDPSLKLTYLIIDALDECVKDLQLLSTLIVKTSSMSRVKWLLSSRNEPHIERGLRLKESQRQLSLELKENADQVSRAVDAYIDHYFSEMTIIERMIPNQNQLQDTLQRKSEGTFLWVALVIHVLRQAEDWEAWDIVNEAPAGLANLYLRMIEQIRKQDRGKPELCQCVLSAVTTTYRPLHVTELGVLAGLPPNISSSYDAIATIVKLCGSFLTIRDQVVYTIHQSAQDFLSKEGVIFPSSLEYVHYDLFSRSLQAMLKILRRDIYGLRTPGILIDQIQQPDPDPLAAVRYSCLYWVDHLLECQREDTIKDLKDSGLVNEFLSKYFLYWLEALSLLKSVSEGVVMIRKLEDLQFNTSLDLSAFLHDARRFTISNLSIIEQAPLQAYCSALLFAPEKSIVRKAFESYIPLWIQTKPRVKTNWNAMLQILEGHTDGVTSVAFSPNGKQIVSGSRDTTVRRWDAGHTDEVTSVAFSPDGKQIVSGSEDTTVRRWDAATGQQLLPALEGHISSVTSVAFSPDGKQIVSGSGDTTVRRWDVATGQQLLPALEGHTSWVYSVAFSPDGKQIVSGSGDTTVRRWDAATGQQLLPALEGHTSWVYSVAFSPDGKQIVSGSGDTTVRRWDVATGQQLLPALEGHTSWVYSVAFSPDGKQIVSGSEDTTVRRWDAATGQLLLPALEGHTSSVTSVAFSPDGKQIVSGSGDTTVRRWDAATGQQLLPALEGHISWVYSVAFSPDGKQIVSGSEDTTVRRWDAATGQLLLPALEGHTYGVTSVAFSPDGKQIVSESGDKTVRRWDAATGQQLLPALEGHASSVTSVAFSPDGKQISTLCVSENWLAEGTTNLLWLPPGYRPTCKATWGVVIALGHQSGGVSILQLQLGPKLMT